MNFENIVRKGENAGNQHFLLFPQCFLTFPKEISFFQSHLFCRLQIFSISTGLKFCRLVKSYLKNNSYLPAAPPGWLSGERVRLMTWWL